MARSPRLHQNVTNMVAAMVVVMLGVGAVFLTTMRTSTDEVSTVDFASELSLARAQAVSFTPVRPLPAEKWEITAASFTRAPGEGDAQDEVETWRVGVRFPSGRFAWIEQVNGDVDLAMQRWNRGGQLVGLVDVLGVPRQHWESGEWQALIFADEGVALGVFGKATLAEITALTQSLSGS